MFEKWKEILLGSEDEQNSTQSLEHNAHAWSVLFCLQRSLFCLQRSLFCLQRSLSCLQRSLFCLQHFFFNVHLFVCSMFFICNVHFFSLQRLFFLCSVSFSLQRVPCGPSYHSDDLALQIVQRTSPEYPWIDLSAQWTLEAYNIPVLPSWAFPRIAFLCNVL